jgi:hypothetical protein
VSGITLEKVLVFFRDSGYKMETINIDTPLSKVSLQEDGDILIVPSIVKPESYVYQYHKCSEGYNLIKTLESGTYDESTAMNSKFILQGN